MCENLDDSSCGCMESEECQQVVDPKSECKDGACVCLEGYMTENGSCGPVSGESAQNYH